MPGVEMTGLFVILIVVFRLLFFVFCLIWWWLLFCLLECGSCIKTCPGTISDEPGIWTLMQFRLRFFFHLVFRLCMFCLSVKKRLLKICHYMTIKIVDCESCVFLNFLVIQNLRIVLKKTKSIMFAYAVT
ncbi:hypothetical protein Hanom_Chr02g00178421 [Helianthus anomalus]